LSAHEKWWFRFLNKGTKAVLCPVNGKADNGNQSDTQHLQRLHPAIRNASFHRAKIYEGIFGRRDICI
jgi:hypothetical protein